MQTKFSQNQTMKVTFLYVTILHLVSCDQSTPRLQPFLNRFCNFLQVKTTATTQAPHIVQIGEFSTVLPAGLTEDEKCLLREELYNITHHGVANKREIDFTLGDLRTPNGSTVQERIARLMLTEVHKHLELKANTEEVDQDEEPEEE